MARLVYNSAQRARYCRCNIQRKEKNSPKSRGCVTQAAMLLALPPNQKGYRTGGARFFLVGVVACGGLVAGASSAAILSRGDQGERCEEKKKVTKRETFRDVKKEGAECINCTSASLAAAEMVAGGHLRRMTAWEIQKAVVCEVNNSSGPLEHSSAMTSGLWFAAEKQKNRLLTPGRGRFRKGKAVTWAETADDQPLQSEIVSSLVRFGVARVPRSG